MMRTLLLMTGLWSLATAPALAQTELYRLPAGESHWISPENPTGAHGAAGVENNGAKGHPYDTIAAHGSLVLADIQGQGMIDRMWMTINDRSPERLRALRLDMYWDGAKTPAVSVPLGDFFAQNVGEMVRMDNALFASPEARSFVSYVPMPFRKGARVVLTNESDTPLNNIYYDIDYRTVKDLPDDALYFHAWWSRNRATTPGKDFDIMPAITGRGRFLGASVGVETNPVYGKSWWGEGEVRIFLDGDKDHPSLSGTGTEDYIGTGWGEGAYTGRYQGAPVADEGTGRWAFYRFHVPDPVVFDNGVHVTLQQIGGWSKADVAKLRAAGAPLIPVTVDGGSRAGFKHLLDGATPMAVTDPSLPDGWTNFYRSDDVSAVAYFYLDRPENGLPPIAPVAERTAALRVPKP